MKWFLILCLFLTSISFSLAANDQESDSVGLEENLKNLLAEDQDMAALRLALRMPKEAQFVLEQYKGSNSRSEYVGWLIQSEILFAEKKNDEALKLLRKFIAKIEPLGSKKTWKEGVIPANYYLSIYADLSRRVRSGNITDGGMIDNLVLQRLLQFKQDELAENEYQRIMANREILNVIPTPENSDFKITRVNLMNFELAIEYCNFLRTRNKSAQARELLLSELDSIDLNAIFESPSSMFGHHNSINGKPRIRVEQFIKLSYGYFKLDNKLDELFAHLAQSKSKSAMLILAKIQAQLGNHDKALELAVKHAHTVPSTPSNLAYRLGKTYHYFAKYEEAIVEFEKFIKLHLREKNNPQKNTYNLAWYQLNAHSVNAELQACYLATMNTQKLIQTKLTAILYGQHYRIHTDLETVKAFAIQSNHEEVYNTWAAHTLNQKDTSLLYKAHIAYVNGDIEQALDYSEQAALQKNLYDYSRWGEIHAQLGKRGEWIEILRELYRVAKDDQKIYAQRRLITYLRDDTTDAEVISLYENVMASPQHMSEERNDGYSASDFKSKGHVSNRLLDRKSVV